MRICPICGSTVQQIKEWRHCPKQNKLICGSKHCAACEYFRQPEDAGTLWCTYYIGRKNEKNELQQRIVQKELEIAQLYAGNNPKDAENQTWELINLQKKLRRINNGGSNRNDIT